MVVKAKYLYSMKEDTNWYWNQQHKHRVIKVPTLTILYPRFEVNSVTDSHAIPKSVCNRTQEIKSIWRQPICLTGSDYDYILEEIGCPDKIEFERDVKVYSDDEEN